MNRYYVKTGEPYRHITGVWRTEPDGDVELGDDVYFTKAEAHIIAFALNAVADGATLRAFHADSKQVSRYNGPTEGVAP